MQLQYYAQMVKLLPHLPLMYLQSQRMRRKIPKLPEADKPKGVVFRSNYRKLKLVLLGESTFAGVGVKTHKDGFAGTLAYGLSETFRATVDWTVYAKSGYTAGKVLDRLLPIMDESKADVVLIGLGGNDAFEFSSPRHWTKNIENLLEAIRSRFGNVPIVFANMPPVRDFPALTPLMHRILGSQIDLLGKSLKHVVSKYSNVYYDSSQIRLVDWLGEFEQPLSEGAFFSDGVHPSQLTYQAWASNLAKFIGQNINPI